MKSRKSAIKTDLFAADLHHHNLDQFVDLLLRIGSCIDFTALAAQVDGAGPGIERLELAKSALA